MIRSTAIAAFWILAAGIAFVTLCPIDLRPMTGHVVLERSAAYFLLGVALSLAYPDRPLAAMLTVAAIAVTLEAAQTFVPGRHGHVIDALEKLAGGLLGALVGAMAWQAAARWLPRLKIGLKSS
jgi:VanZ family protein